MQSYNCILYEEFFVIGCFTRRRAVGALLVIRLRLQLPDAICIHSYGVLEKPDQHRNRLSLFGGGGGDRNTLQEAAFKIDFASDPLTPRLEPCSRIL